MIVPHQPVTNVFASDQVFDLARSWLQTCEDTHEECKDVDDAPLLPARVIEVTSTDAGFTARVIPSAKGQRSQYLCLSYCWGGNQNVTATQVSLSSLKEEIPMDKLGLTIRDAIETTSRLGFKYLWVDALCILQDDVEDKMANIQHMAHIYKHATAVISAATASNSNEGFLRSNRTPVSEGYAFTLRLPHNSTARLTLVSQMYTYLNHPLDERGWVLQEHLLSRRNLMFSNYEMLVACRTHKLESLTKSCYPYMNWSIGHPSLMKVRGMEIRFFMANWNWIISMFTLRHLSNPEDRIYAFQGIADEVSNEWESPVEFGIVARAPETLGWYIVLPTTLRTPGKMTTLRTQRAPSWSWMWHNEACSIALGSWDEPNMKLRFDDDKRILIVHACIISGAEKGGCDIFSGIVHGDDLGRFYPDTNEPLPQQQDLVYLDFGAGHMGHPFLVLVSAKNGMYRRVGLYTSDIVDRNWGGILQEVKLV